MPRLTGHLLFLDVIARGRRTEPATSEAWWWQSLVHILFIFSIDIAPYRMVRSDRIFEFSTLVLDAENLVNFSSYTRTSRALTHPVRGPFGLVV